ncbi:hypothetical protein BKA63DRAFT_413755 [Paraphoma chrysanthemicola]|nr:hypothetical protein BKA63DRAFT_413755 [Paraphoma chrysanthemicola]
MELHCFGHPILSHSRLPTRANATAQSFTTTSCLSRRTIEVLWLSWCDMVVQIQDSTDTRRLMYLGTGLTEGQIDHLIRAGNFGDTSSMRIAFFGSELHDGLRGYVHSQVASSRVVIFATDLEMEAGSPETSMYTADQGTTILAIQMTSGGSLLVSVKSEGTGQKQIFRFKDIGELRTQLESNLTLTSTLSSVEYFTFSHWCVNATTSVAVDPKGRVYTMAHDARYPACLGRPYERNAGFEQVSYLSETVIDSIASGGYLSTALSSDGELFIWGQECPGFGRPLSVLRPVSRSNLLPEGTSNGVFNGTTEDDRDDLITLLTVQINGQMANVYDVAIGHGHMLVAAELREASGLVERRVFAAGDNRVGQLGLGLGKKFVADFEEVILLRNKEIVQLAAAAWSTSVVALV